MIKPTVGRIVWYRAHRGAETQAAIVTRASEKGTHVDLTVFPALAATETFASVVLLQDDEAPPPIGHFCEWMPYQKGQAARADHLEKLVAGN